MQWLFLFKMSHIRLFPLNIQWRQAQISWEEHILRNLSSWSLVCYCGVHVYRFPLHHSVGKALVDSFHRKKQYIWLLPPPLPPL